MKSGGQPASSDDSASSHAVQIAREFEDFAYIVSHDLNAPLRHVKEFTRLLIGGRGKNLSEEEQQYIAFLNQSLKKIDDMQASLLVFSRLNTRAGEMRHVDLNQTIAAVLKDMTPSINMYAPVFECANMPVILAEPNQMNILFTALMDNAIKFHENDLSKRKIIISATDQGDLWLFEIRDNGIGIEERYHDEVFRLFRQLEPGKYGGTGVGLTIARKIIQRHGGEMIIESRINEGTRVFFSLPKSGKTMTAPIKNRKTYARLSTIKNKVS